MTWYDPTSWGDESESAKAKRLALENVGQGAESRAYLDDDVVGTETGSGDDAVDDTSVRQEVLTKRFRRGNACVAQFAGSVRA